MAEFGVTEAGFLAPRAIDLREQIRQSYEATTGLSVDWSADVFLGVITAVIADRMGDLSEMAQAIADARDPNNATGIFLDSIAALVGVSRIPAAVSRVDLALTGDPTTLIPGGSEVEHPNGSLWRTSEDAIIGAGGDVVVEASPQETGAIPGPATDEWEITTPVDGWDDVESFAPATLGRDRETDAQLRLRRQQSLQIQGFGAPAAIRANVLEIDGIQAAVVVDNDEPDEAIVAGLALEGKSLAVVVYPDVLTAAQREDLAVVIYARKPAGIKAIGDEEEIVTGADGFEKTIRWFFADEIPAAIAVDYEGDAGLAGDVEDTVEDYFAGLGVGEPARILAVLARLEALGGVVSATVTFDGSAVDLSPEITEILIADTITVTPL